MLVGYLERFVAMMKRPAWRPRAITGLFFCLGTLLAGFTAAAPAVATEATFADIARQSGEPQVPGLTIVYLHPLGPPSDGRHWKNIVAHQSESPPGTARALALAQSKTPTRRGVTLWVETDGTVYWSTAETAIPTHGDGFKRRDNKYIDNTRTYREITKSNAIGVEFVGNFPNVAKPVTSQQMIAWLILVQFLQERYGVPASRIYAHNWIDYKDARYCEGCDIATAARSLGYVPTRLATPDDAAR
jgi:hypothetical protein